MDIDELQHSPIGEAYATATPEAMGMDAIEVEVPDFDPATMPTKIALVGFTASRDLAPWGDPEWSIFGCNNLHTFIDDSKFAGWFDLHDVADIRKDEDHCVWLTKTKLPVFTWRPQEEWPTTIPYPRDDILDGFARFRGARYFTNSISWMIAWALMQLQPALLADVPVQLGVYGVDMAQGGEYATQRPSCEYWLGLAEAAGVEVVLPDTSDLLKAASLYGAEDDSALRTKLVARSTELDQRAVEVEAETQRVTAYLSELHAMQHQLIGAKESNNYILGVWTQPGDNPRQGADPTVVSSDGASPPVEGPAVLEAARAALSGVAHA